MLGAIAKAAVSGTAKKTAKKAAKKLTGAAELLQNDESITKRTLQNARRRYQRRAERLQKRIDSSASMLEKERLKKQLESNLKKSFALFADRKARERFAKKWNLPKQAETNLATARRYFEQSKNALEGIRTATKTRRERAAKEILSTEIGSRIYAATKDIWAKDGVPEDKAVINERIMKAFGASDMMEVIERFEQELGTDFYKPPAEFETVSDSPGTVNAERIAREIARNPRNGH